MPAEYHGAKTSVQRNIYLFISVNKVRSFCAYL